jgi:hypothetical protein
MESHFAVGVETANTTYRNVIIGFVQRRVSSMAKTFVFGISTSEPASGLTNRVSSRSSRNVPLKLSLILPRPSCTTTGRPIQGSNELLIASPAYLYSRHGKHLL